MQHCESDDSFADRFTQK